MKTSLLITVIILVLNFKSLSQKRQDSIVVSSDDISCILEAFNEWKILKPQNTYLFERVGILENRIGLKDSIIAEHKKIMALDAINISLYKTMEDNLLQINRIQTKAILDLQKEKRKQKTKTTIGSIAGGLLFAAYIILKK